MKNIKISFLGDCYSGKTSLINQIINHSFSHHYSPTHTRETYTLKTNLNLKETLSDKEITINVILEDLFGVNNSLLFINEEITQSKILRDKHKSMTKIFKEIMFTSRTKKTITNINFFNSSELSEYPTTAFIFVCDCTNPKSTSSVIKIIDRLIEIERTNNSHYPKMILFNKADKIKKVKFNKDFQQYQKKLKGYKKKQNIESFCVSALSTEGVFYSFNSFLSKVYNKIIACEMEKEISCSFTGDTNKLYTPMCIDNINSCSKKVFCGNHIFFCDNRSDTE